MRLLWNSECMSGVFALPCEIADKHLPMAGRLQLGVLIWFARQGNGEFDEAACATALRASEEDCKDALLYWIQAGILTRDGEKAPRRKTASAHTATQVVSQPVTPEKAPSAATPARRPTAVKPQMTEVVKRQKADQAFAFLLDTVSARLGKPIGYGDMETLLYLYETAGLPAEVILMVVGYAIHIGKPNMRYIERTALDWADRGFVTIDAADDHLRMLERRLKAWQQLKVLLLLSTASPTSAQMDAAERWIFEWKMSDELIKHAYALCEEKTGKFQSAYMDRILDNWRQDGVKDPSQLTAKNNKKKAGSSRNTSFNLEEYDAMVADYTPHYQSGKKE